MEKEISFLFFVLISLILGLGFLANRIYCKYSLIRKHTGSKSRPGITGCRTKSNYGTENVVICREQGLKIVNGKRNKELEEELSFMREFMERLNQ